jgi:hypothetical protein
MNAEVRAHFNIHYSKFSVQYYFLSLKILRHQHLVRYFNYYSPIK